MAPVVLAVISVVVITAILTLVLRRGNQPVVGADTSLPQESASLAEGTPPPLIPSEATPVALGSVSNPDHTQEKRTNKPVIEMVRDSSDVQQPDKRITEARRQSEEKDTLFESRGKVVIRPECEFVQLLPGQLKPVVVVPQAPDNQWIPNQLYSQMKIKQWSLLDPKVRERLEPMARAEWLRALINSDQVVVNRAFLYNNPALFQDFVKEEDDDPERRAFKEMLARGDIVPYLLNEQTPVPEKPPAFGVLDGFQAWRQICQEVRSRCIRLDWNNDKNKVEITQWMTRRFHDLALTAQNQDMRKLIQDLALGAGAETQLQQRLIDLAEWCLKVKKLKITKGDDPFVTRNEIYGGYDLERLKDGTYQKGPNYIPGFVVADGTDPAQGVYDFSKPFGREIQRLMDLGYNSYLADAIKGYPLTPTEALPRTALQELEQAARQPDTVTGGQLLDLFQNAAFALTEKGLSLPFMGVLHLSDVWQIRQMDEWLLYIQSVEDLLRDPLQFADPDRGARAVYMAYHALAQRMAGLVTTRYAGEARKLLAPWLPRIEFVLDIGLKTLTLHWSPAGVFFSTKLADKVVHGAVTVVGQLVVRGYSQARVGADLATSFVFMKRTLPDAQAGWDQIIDGLRQQGFKERPIDKIEEEGTMNYNQQLSDPQDMAAAAI